MRESSKRQSFTDITFDDCRVPPGLEPALRKSTETIAWSQMKTHDSKFRGFQALCLHCGAMSWGAWKPKSTRGWRDNQRANLMHFIGMEMHPDMMRPLEESLPMV